MIPAPNNGDFSEIKITLDFYDMPWFSSTFRRGEREKANLDAFQQLIASHSRHTVISNNQIDLQSLRIDCIFRIRISKLK